MDIRKPVSALYGDWMKRFGDSWKQQVVTLQQNFGAKILAVSMPQDHAVDVPVITVRKDAVVEILQFLKSDPAFSYNFLADQTATDEMPRVPRFDVVYNLFSHARGWRIRVKTPVAEGEEVATATVLWDGANFSEREIFDMFGIRFAGHPDLRRILMDERYQGHPLRKDFPLKAAAGQIFVEPERANPALLESAPSAQPHDPDDIWDDARMVINIGPTHPSMHGALRMVARLNGETIEKSYVEFGYTHRAKEKLGENRTYHQFVVYSDRLNYCSAIQNNVHYAMAVERLMGIEVPDRTVWIRMICAEMARVTDHLVCFGINAVDLGAFSYFLYGYHEREEAYTLIEQLCGARLTTSYTRIGGLMQDAPNGWEKRVRKWALQTRKTLDQMDRLLTGNKIWHKRTVGVSVFNKEQCLRYSYTGPNARAAGVDIDLRRDQPYMFYKDVKFEVPVGQNGDIFDRYLVRVEEVRQSLNIILQCVEKLKPGPIWADDKRVRIPDKTVVHNTMEGLIYHFKFFMSGFVVPEGEAYTMAEASNGELGFYIVSKGAAQAHRMRIRGPSVWHFQGIPEMVQGGKIADMVGALGSINVIAGEIDR